MGVDYKSKHLEVAAAMRAQRAVDLNFQAEKHIAWAEFRVPIDKGNLIKTIRQTEVATADSLRAVVAVGGQVVNDVAVDYAAHVNYGTHHELPNGRSYDIPANPFWTEAEEVGRDAGQRRERVREIEAKTGVRVR